MPVQAALPSFRHVKLHICVLGQVAGLRQIAVPSVEFLTATKRSKLSSTRILTASERASMDCLRWYMPAERSWYVALGCTMERKALGSKDLEEMTTEASGTVFRRVLELIGSCVRTGLHVHLSDTAHECQYMRLIMPKVVTHLTSLPNPSGSPPSPSALAFASEPATESSRSWSISSHWLRCTESAERG